MLLVKFYSSFPCDPESGTPCAHRGEARKWVPHSGSYAFDFKAMLSEALEIVSFTIVCILRERSVRDHASCYVPPYHDS